MARRAITIPAIAMIGALGAPLWRRVLPPAGRGGRERSWQQQSSGRRGLRGASVRPRLPSLGYLPLRRLDGQGHCAPRDRLGDDRVEAGRCAFGLGCARDQESPATYKSRRLVPAHSAHIPVEADDVEARSHGHGLSAVLHDLHRTPEAFEPGGEYDPMGRVIVGDKHPEHPRQSRHGAQNGSPHRRRRHADISGCLGIVVAGHDASRHLMLEGRKHPKPAVARMCRQRLQPRDRDSACDQGRLSGARGLTHVLPVFRPRSNGPLRLTRHPPGLGFNMSFN